MRFCALKTSFVAKVASRVSELLPQRTWLNRWLSPAEANAHLPTSTPLANSHINISPDHGPGPSKRPRLPLNSPPYIHNKFLQSTIHEEEISPIGPATIPNDTAIAGPSGLCQLNQKNNFTPTLVGAGEPPQLKLENKLSSVAAQRSSAATSVTTADKLNGDDCSETSESTSGCSSLVPQAQTSQSRRSESRHLNFTGGRSGTSGLNRSLFPGRSSSKIDLTSLHRRRPSFDTTAFTTSSRLTHISVSPNVTSSPFYRGRTMYGGASAYNSTSSGLFTQTPRRSGITVRPVNVNTPTEPALSTTARKILDALEQFSTPVADAKRLPIVPGTKRKLERYAELSLPTTTELLRVKRRERLQKSTSAARQASLSSSHQSSKSFQSESAYRIRNKESDEKRTGKITRKCSEVYKQLEEFNLPAAVLPVKTLPKIDIPLPPCPTCTSINMTSVSTTNTDSTTNRSTIASSVIQNNSPICATSLGQEFKISPPLPVKADNFSRTCLNAESFNFVFCEPIRQKNNKMESTESLSSNSKKADCSNSFSFISAVCDKRVGTVASSDIMSVKSNNSAYNKKDDRGLTSTTAKTVEHSATFTTTTSTDAVSKTCLPGNSYWKCSMCMVKNNQDVSECVACNTKKTTVSVSSSSPLSFKPPPDTWECKECFIRNKNSVSICAACASPKVVKEFSVSTTSTTATTTAVSNVSSVNSSTTTVSSTTSSGFGDKFKPPSDTWECKECFVRNKNTSNKCVSCESIKPGALLVDKQQTVSSGFGSMFKKPEGCWECNSCMVQNDSKALQCVACTTPKPGAEKNTAVTSSSVGFGFKFGIDQAASSGTGFIPVTSASATTNKEGFKMNSDFQFGSVNTSLANSNLAVGANFTFGIPSAKSTSDADNLLKEKKNCIADNKTPNPLVELAKVQEKCGSDQSTSIFKFGVNHEKNTEKLEGSSDRNTNKNLFNTDETTKSNELKIKVDDELKNKSGVVSNKFIFGASPSLEKTDSVNKASNFIFQAKPEQISALGTNLVFGNTAAKITQGEVKNTTQSEIFTFGSSTASNNAAFSTSTTKSNPNPLFVFGSASSANENKSNSSFGSSGNNDQKQSVSVSETKSEFSSGKETAPVFGTAKSDISVTTVFGNSLDSKPVLSSSLTNSTNVPTFANAASSNNNIGTSQGGFKLETSAPSFLAFGSSNTQSPFQNPSRSQQQEKPLFSLTNSNPGLQTVTTTQSTGFSFGASAVASNNNGSNTEVKAAFVFSSQTPSSGFSFAAPSTTPAQNFNFTPKEAEPCAPFSFSAVPVVQNNPTPAAFGVQNPTPSFGSSSTPNNLFSFGAHSAQPQPQSASNTPVFGFTGMQGSNSSPNAFIFGSSNADTNPAAPTTQPSVPAFNPNVRPTFNFTSGSTPPSFTATPNPLSGTTPATPVSRRPIKKAVRRAPLR
ncbi:nucleoporin 153 isoform X2 [Lycorma delicatula]|uniref:nucleoporin 153 isoform X2 n=1 Tax=Lycorma delicatula TaxID=130591 RepID=UPI003F51769F